MGKGKIFFKIKILKETKMQNPENWDNEKGFTFEHLEQLIQGQGAGEGG